MHARYCISLTCHRKPKGPTRVYYTWRIGVNKRWQDCTRKTIDERIKANLLRRHNVCGVHLRIRNRIDHTRLYSALCTIFRINTLDVPRFVFAHRIGLHTLQQWYTPPFVAFVRFNVSDLCLDVCRVGRNNTIRRSTLLHKYIRNRKTSSHFTYPCDSPRISYRATERPFKIHSHH